jgi:hypothetical protein
MRKHVSAFVLVTMLLFTFGLFAQESAVKGGLGGTVFDSSGAVVSNAKVTLKGPTGTATTTTDSGGRFNFDILTPGMYSVRTEMTGFKPVEIKSVEVFTNRTSGVRVTLEPGGATETVEVSAAAVGVDMASTGVGANLNDTFYQSLPIGRGVTSIFYAAAGVAGGGGTGAANPSIAGGSGLENQYVADGVNITDGAFGGIGVFSRVYGPLATGINLSFVKEVQVKTAGYEPQYGKSTGGIIQIVTKSGTNEYHGSLSGFIAPKGFEARRLNPDAFGRFNQAGVAVHQSAWDVNAELGGPVPGLKDKLFFFAAFNPSYNAYYDRFANMHGVVGLPVLPESTLGQYAYDYSGKLTWRIGDRHSVESSVFGDPTRENGFRPNFFLQTFSTTTFDKLENGTRNWVARYNGTLSPTWLFNASFSWGHNYLTDIPAAPDVYSVADLTGRSSSTGDVVGSLGPLSGQYQRQGLSAGFFENTEGDNYAVNFDTQKIAHLLGEHTFSVGYRYERNSYVGTAERTGPKFPITQTMADNACGTGGCNEFVGLMDNASFQLRLLSGSGVFANIPGRGPSEVALLQTRGTFSNPAFDTHGRYHSAYVNDSWAIGRHITANVGWRWEQQYMLGTPYTLAGVTNHVHYTFTDNWSPRLGLSIDPLGDRKTKLSANWARYSYAIPLDMAIRSLSNEQDAYNNFWLPPSDGAGNMLVNPDGTIPLTAADFNDSTQLSPFFISGQSGTAIAPGTKMQYLDEFAAGAEHEWRHGIVTSIRFQQRRLRRIVEDMAGPSPEAANAGVIQIYQIGNPLSSTDLFINGNQIKYPTGAPPAACAGAPFSLDPVTDTFNNNLGGVCITNKNAGEVGSDGIPDGFVNPVRNYKAVEVEIAKNFSAGWQMRTNYRWSTLAGNYEGAFRNDNQQSDPSISSLFDFTPGTFGLLGDQFAIGFLNTDRRHIFNNFLSYTFSSSFLKNLTIGTGVRVESGVPANDLKAHPVYLNAGEIPSGGRGSLGRIGNSGQADIHTDYFFKTSEQTRLHFGADLFNITNQRNQLRIDQNEDRSFGVPNVDFKKPVGSGNIGVPLGFQRPFYGRLFIRWEF